MQTSPLTGSSFGTELTGHSLADQVDDDCPVAVRAAFDSGLLVARGQSLAENDQIRVMRWLGDLRVFPWGSPVEYMSNVIPDNPSMGGTRRLLFHVDGAYAAHLWPATSLYAVEVSPDTSPTAFASSVRAYESLSSDVKALIDRLSAYNTLDTAARHRDEDPIRVRVTKAQLDDAQSPLMTAVHPVVITVPHTGDRALFVSESNTSHIVEYGPESMEGEELLQILFRALYDDDNIYTHHYRNGDFVLWNNFAVQHARTEKLDHRPRTLRRMMLSSLNW